MSTVGHPCTMTPPCAVRSPILAAGLPPTKTVGEPCTIVSGPPAHVARSPTRACGIPPEMTVGQQAGSIGPPTCGTRPVTIGQACMSPSLAAGVPNQTSKACRYPELPAAQMSMPRTSVRHTAYGIGSLAWATKPPHSLSNETSSVLVDIKSQASGNLPAMQARQNAGWIVEGPSGQSDRGQEKGQSHSWDRHFRLRDLSCRRQSTGS